MCFDQRFRNDKFFVTLSSVPPNRFDVCKVGDRDILGGLEDHSTVVCFVSLLPCCFEAYCFKDFFRA